MNFDELISILRFYEYRRSVYVSLLFFAMYYDKVQVNYCSKTQRKNISQEIGEFRSHALRKSTEQY